MEQKTFVKNDCGFICKHCGREVKPLGYTSRNHCPYCLWSLHVDVNPGDRDNACQGEMEPILAIPDNKKDFILVHKCTICGEERKNRIANDDNRSLLIKLTTGKR